MPVRAWQSTVRSACGYTTDRPCTQHDRNDRPTVGHDLVQMVTLTGGAGSWHRLWHLAPTEDRAMHLPGGAGEPLELQVQPTEACASVRVLANGQVLAPAAGLAADAPATAPLVYKVNELPAGPLVLEVEAVAREPLPAAVPLPWERFLKFAPATPPGAPRQAHRSVLTLCVLVEPPPPPSPALGR